jgi:hypothetical protein
MSKTATIKAVNGSGVSDDRPCGVASLRDREARSLISLVCDALSETSEVSHRMHTAIYQGDDGDGATDLGRRIVDALVCLQATDHYLRMLRDVLAEQANGTPDPWTAEPAF